jgi:zinc/manganese transport system substrate-binding protein
VRIVLVSVAIAAVTAGCGGRTAAGDRVRVVAAENEYGDIAQQIGGRFVDVTSLLSNPAADPHLFEPATRNGLEVAQARLVIENGLGYDSFVEKLEHAAPSSSRSTLVIADALGVHGRDANPHLWYDVPRLPRIASAIARSLATVDPVHAASYRSRAHRFVASLAPLVRTVARIRADNAGAPVAYTEPVPGYLVAAAGLVNLAPAAFTRALQDGAEPPPQAVAELADLINGRRIRALLYNSQAVSPLTARLRDAAAGAGIPVVAVTETLPKDTTFQHWQLAQARALADALEG